MSGKRWIWGPGLALLTLAGAGLWASGDTLEYLRIGVGYAAKQTCSCVFVAGRSARSCQAELPEGAEIVSLRIGRTTVEGAVLAGLVSAKAAHEDGFGCRLVR
jgi:hypothetical protein